LSTRPGRAHRHPLGIFLALTVLALGTVLSGATSAHDLLRRSVPRAGGVVPPGPLLVALDFSGRIDHDLSELVLLGPDGMTRTLPFAPDRVANVISATTDLPSGRYVLRWTVMSSDGHLTRGTIPFEVKSDR